MNSRTLIYMLYTFLVYQLSLDLVGVSEVWESFLPFDFLGVKNLNSAISMCQQKNKQNKLSNNQKQ